MTKTMPEAIFPANATRNEIDAMARLADMPSASRTPSLRGLGALSARFPRSWRPLRFAGLLAVAAFVSCNLNESGESGAAGRQVVFAPRILPAGGSLPEIDSVRLQLSLEGRTPIDTSIAWSRHEFVFPRVPVGSGYTLVVEGLKLGMDRRTLAVWWRAEKKGTVAAAAEENAFSPVVVVEALADTTVPVPGNPPATNPATLPAGTASATLTFTAPLDADSVYVDGKPEAFRAGQAVSVSVPFTGSETEKAVVIRIVDSTRNVWQETVMLRRAASPGGQDTTRPRITLLSPSRADTTLPAGASSLLVRVRASDSSGMKSVTIGGQPAGTADSLEWSLDLPVQSGIDTIVVVATDKAGNVTRDSFTVTVPQSPRDVRLISLGVSTETVVVAAPRAPDTVWQVTVPNRETELVLRPLAGDSHARILFEGKPVDSTIRLPLSYTGGRYPIVLVVRSATGDSSQGYLLQIEHQPLTDISLEPLGGSEQSARWSDSIVRVAWTVKGVRDLGTVLIDGKAATCVRDTCTDSVRLVEGPNTIGIGASYRDVQRIWTDSITITRWAKPKSNDAGLVTFGVDIPAVLDGSDSNWVAVIPAATRAIVLAPKAANDAANIAIGGEPTTRKTFLLRPEGDTLPDVVVTVTSEDKSAVRTHHLRILHPAMGPIAIAAEGARNRSVTFGITSAEAAWTIASTDWPLDTVTIDGTPVVQGVDGRYTKRLLLPIPGMYHTVLRARYQGGKTEWTDSVSIERRRDDSIPVITRGPGASMRAVPFDTTRTSAAWRVTDNHKLAWVKIDGKDVLPQNGLYRVDLDLTNMRTPVVLVAQDSTGNQAKDSLEIVRSNDRIDPTFLRGCGAGCQTVVEFETMKYTASWKVTDNDALSYVSIAGTEVQGQSDTYEREVALKVGDNAIVLVARDRSNNETRDTLWLTRRNDRTPPTVQRAGGTRDTSVAFSTRTALVGWSVTDNDRVDSVTIGGVRIQSSSTLHERTVALDTLVNVIRFVAKDPSGNTTPDSITIFRQSDRTAPSLTVRTQTRTVPGSQASLEIVCSVADTESHVQEVRIGGIGVSGAGSYYTRTVPLNPGFNAIRIVALDSARNQSEQTLTILRDDSAPGISATSRPASGFLPWVKGGTGSFTASWTLRDNHKIDSVKINGEKVSGTTAGVYSKTISYGIGRNVVTLEARDSVGNIKRDSIVFEAGQTDAEGNWYKIRLMPDGKVWMAQNLRTQPKNGGAEYACGGGGATDSCAKYGLQYDWAEAMDIDSSFNKILAQPPIATPFKGLCPLGWHIPDSTEWSTLLHKVAIAQGYPATDSAGAYALRSADFWSAGFGDSARAANLYDDFLVPTYETSDAYGSHIYVPYWLPAERSQYSAYYVRFAITAGMGFGKKNDPREPKSLRCLAD